MTTTTGIATAPRGQAPTRKDRILVVGTARSGTSWLAKALGHAENTRHFPEPDNIDTEHEGRPAGYLGFGAYPIIDPGETPASLTALWDFVFQGRIPANRKLQLAAGRRFVRLPRSVRDPIFKLAAGTLRRMPGGPSHRVVKSIFIMFSLDWIIERYHPQILLIQRNPLNVVSSWVQLGISSFDLPTRPVLRERYLDRWGVPPPDASAEPHELAAWSLGLLTGALAEAHAEHPEWPLYTHEDLCVDSAARIREVYERADLVWGERSQRYLAEADRPGEGLRPVRVTSEQPHRWKERLNAEQVELINRTLEQFPTRGWITPPQ